MEELKFFTDKTVVNDYLLVKIKDYWKLKDFSQWKEVFIDPGVYELTKDVEYSWVNKSMYGYMEEWIKNLPDTHYFSWDYPCDMNRLHTDYFLKKSWNNAKKYCKFSQYIVTVQFKFRNYWNFIEWFDIYNALNISSGILALGNMCRFRTLNNYIKHALDYAFSHTHHPRIHIYGLCLKAIPYAHALAKRFNIELSFDSTKWTRCYHSSGLPSCSKENRQQYFDEYKKEIEVRIK